MPYFPAVEQPTSSGNFSTEEYDCQCEAAAQYDEYEEEVASSSPPSSKGAIAIGPYQFANHHCDGLFSYVYKARAPPHSTSACTPAQSEDNQPEIVALKVTTPSLMEAPHDSEREARILSSLKTSHDNHVIPLLDSFRIEGSRFVLVFPFMNHEFSDLLAASSISASQARSILFEVFSGLAHLHSHGIIHRDVKPSNILLRSKNGPAFLSDFGIAWSPLDPSSEKPDRKITDVGTTHYRPPELLFGQEKYGCSLDLWAMGCVVAEAVGGRGSSQRSLFDAGDLGSELALIKSMFMALGTPSLEVWPEAATFRDWGKMQFTEYPKSSWDRLLPNASTDARDLVSKLVVYESGDRLQASEALKHRYFAEQ